MRVAAFKQAVSALLLLIICLLVYSPAAGKIYPVNVHLDESPAGDTPAKRLYVTSDPADEALLVKLRKQLIARGARKVNLFLPSLLVFEAPAGLDFSELLSDPGLKVVEEDVVTNDPGDRTVLSPAGVKRMYQKIQSRSGLQSAIQSAPDFWRDTCQDKVIIISDEEVKRVQKAVLRRSPHGQQKTLAQNSEFMVGDILVQLVFPESNGQYESSSENWEEAELSEVIAGAFIGMLDFQQQYSYIPMNMVFRTFTRVKTGFEPVKHSMEDDHLWLNDVMETLGYNDGAPLSSCHRFNNDGRRQYGTDWVFTAFIANSENSPLHRFNTIEYTAYANLGGPYLVMPFPAGENPFGIDRQLLFSQIFQHETCHIFWALDEYPSAPGYCNSHSGYLDIYNRNKLWFGPGGRLDSCQVITPCTMARAKEDLGRPLCNYTAGQMGTVLIPGTGVPRVFDSTPTVEFETAGVETVETDNLTVRLKAISTPVPNKNPFQQPEVRLHYAAPLKDGVFKVDGIGRVTILPEDGRWDEVEEDLVIRLVSLRAGLIQLSVSVRNSVGRTSPFYTKKIFNIGLIYSQFFIDEWREGIQISWHLVGETFEAEFDLHRVGPGPHGEDIMLSENILPADTLNDQFLYFSFFDDGVVPGESYNYYVEGTFTLKRGGQDVVYHSRSALISATAMIPIPRNNMVSYPTPNPFNPTSGKLSLSINVPKTFASNAGLVSPMDPGSSGGLSLSGSGLAEQVTSVAVVVYDVTGRRIKNLYSDRVYSGILTVGWDGTNSNNSVVPSGMYFMRVKAGNVSEVRKVLILR